MWFPSRRRARSASAVFKIIVRHPKNTFATISAKPGHRPPSIAKNRRTSVKMMMDFYAAQFKNRLEAARITIYRPHSHRNRETATFQADGGR
jgi:hypothetical protein